VSNAGFAFQSTGPGKFKAGKHGTSVKVSQGKNTDYKQPKGCTAMFAATFQASKVK
jgi:hypothetical protein